MEKFKLNTHRIKEKAGDIKESLTVLSQYAKQKDQDFLSNLEAIRSARYCFIVLTEAATNIATHLCARLLYKAPSTYAESFFILGEHNLIDPFLAKRLGKMMGFRNLLIHGYGNIDNKRMLQIMRHDLTDLELYLLAIEELIRKQEGEIQNEK